MKQRAFTLIEMVVVLALGVVVIVLAVKGALSFSKYQKNFSTRSDLEIQMALLERHILSVGRKALRCSAGSAQLRCDVDFGSPAGTLPVTSVSFTKTTINSQAVVEYNSGAGGLPIYSPPLDTDGVIDYQITDFTVCDYVGMDPITPSCSLEPTKISTRWGLLASIRTDVAEKNRFFRFRIQAIVATGPAKDTQVEFQSGFFVRNPTSVKGLVYH